MTDFYSSVPGRVKTVSAWLLCMLLPHAVSAAEPLDTDYAARIIWQAQHNGDWLPDIYRLNPQLEDSSLYAIQRAYVSRRLAAGDVIGGYKGSFIPTASMGGVLFGGSAILRPGPGKPPVITPDDYKILVVEAEIGFKFCTPITKPLKDVAALKEAVCALMPVMEIADAAIADFDDVKNNLPHLRSTLISINAASTRTMVGKESPASLPLQQLAVSMNLDGTEIGSRDLTGAADQWQNVLWLVNNYILQQGYTIEPGYFAITGNLTGIHVATEGTYRADFGALGVLELQVQL
jgi:2-keto-4-pentenoate hydratase